MVVLQEVGFRMSDFLFQEALKLAKEGELRGENKVWVPNYPEMADEMVGFVAGKVKEFARQGSR